MPEDFKLPAMRMVRQRYDLPAEVDVSVEIDREFNRIKDALELSHGKRVAVGVGSRVLPILPGSFGRWLQS